MTLAATRESLAAAREKAAGPVILVPTMGALHDGHRGLLRAARELAGRDGTVVMSIFVNPLQFGEAADLERYPRTLEADLEVAQAEGVDIVFAPSVEEMYPRPQRITIDPGPLGAILEGEFRPGHFAGMLTVVLKLFTLVRPDMAIFGQKDAQQLVLIRAMVADFALPIAIHQVPTVRDIDGLALSSRNRFLSPAERAVALSIPAALEYGVKVAGSGPEAVVTATRARLAAGGVNAEYAELVTADSLEPVSEDYRGPALMLIAARIGQTRLIDNVIVEFDATHD
jgi:pantoate--beta-alanine ligase